MSKLVVAGRPSNLRGVSIGAYVEGDMYDICERVKELSRNLFVAPLEPPITRFGKTYHWAVGEVGIDGQDHLVKQFETLDGRVIDDLRYMLGVPFEKRLAEAEKIEEKHKAEHAEFEKEKLYEYMGGPMRHELARTGFTGPLPASYRPMNRTARRHGRRMS